MELEKEEQVPQPVPDKTRPFSLKTVLVPIDFSECSEKALEYAGPFCREFGAQAILLYVAQFHYAGSEQYLDMAEWEAGTRRTAEAKLTELARKTLPEGVKFVIKVAPGRPFLSIVENARNLQADLIIISTHGHTGTAADTLGSTTERVVHYAPCPVLVVRPIERDFLPEATRRPR